MSRNNKGATTALPNESSGKNKLDGTELARHLEIQGVFASESKGQKTEAELSSDIKKIQELFTDVTREDAYGYLVSENYDLERVIIGLSEGNRSWQSASKPKAQKKKDTKAEPVKKEESFTAPGVGRDRESRRDRDRTGPRGGASGDSSRLSGAPARRRDYGTPRESRETAGPRPESSRRFEEKPISPTPVTATITEKPSAPAPVHVAAPVVTPVPSKLAAAAAPAAAKPGQPLSWADKIAKANAPPAPVTQPAPQTAPSTKLEAVDSTKLTPVTKTAEPSKWGPKPTQTASASPQTAASTQPSTTLLPVSPAQYNPPGISDAASSSQATTPSPEPVPSSPAPVVAAPVVPVTAAPAPVQVQAPAPVAVAQQQQQQPTVVSDISKLNLQFGTVGLAEKEQQESPAPSTKLTSVPLPILQPTQPAPAPIQHTVPTATPQFASPLVAQPPAPVPLPTQQPQYSLEEQKAAQAAAAAVASRFGGYPPMGYQQTAAQPQDTSLVGGPQGMPYNMPFFPYSGYDTSALSAEQGPTSYMPYGYDYSAFQGAPAATRPATGATAPTTAAKFGQAPTAPTGAPQTGADATDPSKAAASAAMKGGYPQMAMGGYPMMSGYPGYFGYPQMAAYQMAYPGYFPNPNPAAATGGFKPYGTSGASGFPQQTGTGFDESALYGMGYGSFMPQVPQPTPSATGAPQSSQVPSVSEVKSTPTMGGYPQQTKPQSQATQQTAYADWSRQYQQAQTAFQPTQGYPGYYQQPTMQQPTGTSPQGSQPQYRTPSGQSWSRS